MTLNSTRQCLSGWMKEISKSGYVSRTRRWNVISAEDEEKLWATDVLGKSSPRQLQNTVIYLIGVHFCLTGDEELRRVKFGNASQMILTEDHNYVPCLIYQDVSKTHISGLKSIGKVTSVCIPITIMRIMTIIYLVYTACLFQNDLQIWHRMLFFSPPMKIGHWVVAAANGIKTVECERILFNKWQNIWLLVSMDVWRITV